MRKADNSLLIAALNSIHLEDVLSVLSAQLCKYCFFKFQITDIDINYIQRSKNVFKVFRYIMNTKNPYGRPSIRHTTLALLLFQFLPQMETLSKMPLTIVTIPSFSFRPFSRVRLIFCDPLVVKNEMLHITMWIETLSKNYQMWTQLLAVTTSSNSYL